MDIRKCTVEDAPQLAEWNRQLIVDEQSDNPMSIGQLEARMREFLNGSYEAYVFLDGAEPVGYALVDTGRTPVYLRQFLIFRQYRRSGLGSKAFALLLQTLEVRELDLEVLSRNQAGQDFWESLGFQERSRYLRYNVGKTSHT